jgi:hypothetical protein
VEEGMSEESTYRFTKSVSETYHLSWPGDFAWANITINSIGDLNIQSDYGNYNYGWRSFGGDFKKFLIRICDKSRADGYLYDKLHNRTKAAMVDVKPTIKVWKKEIGRWYGESVRSYIGGMQRDQLKEAVREALEVLDDFQRNVSSECTPDAFYMWMDKPVLNRIIDWEWRIYDGSPHTTGDRACRSLCEQIMPAFADILRKELEDEAPAQKESA